jgi:predicted hydrocarbon binding protein
MDSHVFMEDNKELTLTDYMNYGKVGRSNLGDELPVFVYRLLEYSFREELKDRFGKEEQVEVFRGAGRRAGTYFAQNLLDMSLPWNGFVAQLQARLAEWKIGVLRIESVEEGRIVLTVSEDADCSGLPLLGETVCNYDEGFISGIFAAYTGKEYQVEEVDCWATGDRVCRFRAEVSE